MNYWANDYSPHNGLIIGWGKDQGLSTVFVHDLSANRDRVLFTTRTLAAFATEMRTDSSPETWTLSDTRWSPDGKQFSFHCSTGAIGKSTRFLFLADADGGNLRFFAKQAWAEKPMHDGWYDNHSLFGHDDRRFNELLRQKRPLSELTPEDFTLRVWDLEGRVVIPHLAPPGCHIGVSPDRRWAASESWYTTDPIELNLYRPQTQQGFRVLRTDKVKVVWDLRAHLNPTFSRNSKRLYFNKPVSDQASEVWWADLENLEVPPAQPASPQP
jgi:dipeptidyl aminopeptidase/acylaminoacyl peptidase